MIHVSLPLMISNQRVYSHWVLSEGSVTKGNIHHLLATLIRSLFLFKIWNYVSISLEDSDTWKS